MQASRVQVHGDGGAEPLPQPARLPGTIFIAFSAFSDIFQPVLWIRIRIQEGKNVPQTCFELIDVLFEC